MCAVFPFLKEGRKEGRKEERITNGKEQLAMKEIKDERDTCNIYFGEPPVQVVTLRVSMTVSKNWR